MNYPAFKRHLLNRLKRVHPDVNPKPTAAGETRVLLALLKSLPTMQAQKGLTRRQLKEIAKQYYD